LIVVLVLDSGGVSRLAERSSAALALLAALKEAGLWPALVPSPVLVECLSGNGSRDAGVNRLLKTCDVVEAVPIGLARAASALRIQAGRGSAIDALVVAMAQPGGTVLTGDVKDLGPLAEHAIDVRIQRV
jgi:hypothetical protein